METQVEYKRAKVKPQHTATVFVVDDDISYLDPLATHLERRTKFKICKFTNGEDCISEMDLKPSVVFLDYNLNPEWPNTMNGLDVLQEIRRRNPKTKVVMLSGRDMYQDVVKALKLGAYTYVLKDIETLDAVKKILDTISGGQAMTDKQIF